MITGILRRLGPIGRKLAWDREFSGTPSFCGERSETMLRLARKYGNGKDVIELGCGDGSLARALWPCFYWGYDVSPVAIAKARELQKRPGCRFSVSAMEDWRPRSPFDLLILEEVLYYASPADQRDILNRAFESGAKILMTVHDNVKHAATLGVCREVGRVLEHVQDGKRVYLVLAQAAN